MTGACSKPYGITYTSQQHFSHGGVFKARFTGVKLLKHDG